MNQNQTNHKNCSHTKEKFPDYLTLDLEPTAVDSVRHHVAACTSCRTELEELTTTWTQLGVLPEEQPGPNLRKNFYSMLESYKEGMNRESLFQRFFNPLTRWNAGPRRPVYQLVFTIVILVIGFAAGNIFSPGPTGPDPQHTAQVNQLRGEVQQMRQQLAISLMDQSSPSQRIKGVSWSSTVANPGQKTLATLLDTLNNDTNVNVRLSVVDALYLFSSHPMVKEGIIQSLPRQTSPLVQVALIDLMVELREKKAVDALKQLIQNNKLNPAVIQRAKRVIQNSI
ncbi:MAG: HEAT repeat domain-containing protein [bacterium]|nr:HEAT repeat domain-containing protein [bacterium]